MDFWARTGSSMVCRIRCFVWRGCRGVGLRLGEKSGTLDLGGEIVAAESVGERTLLEFWQHG